VSETREVVRELPPAHTVDTTDWHPKLVRLYRYWVTLSEQAGGTPLRRSFDPTVVPDLLSHIWMLDIQLEPTFRLRYRLLGTRIEHLLGRLLRGCWLDECHPHIQQHHDYFERYREVAVTGIPSRRKKPPSFWHDKVSLIENLVLPFSEHGGRADCFMIQTRFYRSDGKEM
jgi:hypothetical protein